MRQQSRSWRRQSWQRARTQKAVQQVAEQMSPEIKFYPHESGQQDQAVTYATIKEQIISYEQRTYCYGEDIAGSLQDLKKLDLKQQQPTPQESTEKEIDSRKLEQDGFHII